MNFDDPRNQGLLALAAGLMAPSRGGTFGGAALQGLQGYQQAYGNASNAQSQAEQLKMMREKYAFEMEGARAARERQAALTKLAEQYMGAGSQPKYQTPAANVDALGGMPAQMGAQPVRSPGASFGTLDRPPVDPIEQQRSQALMQMATLDPEYAAKLQAIVTPKREKLVFQDDRAMDPYTGQVRATYDKKPDLTPLQKEMQAAGIDPASPEAQALLRKAIEKKTTHAPAANIVNNVGDKSLGNQIGPMLKADREQLSGATALANSADRMLGALNSGNVITGPTATLRLRAAQIGQMLGFGGKDSEETILRTRRVVRELADASVEARKLLAGQGQVTENEAKAVEKARSGDIDSLTVPEIRAIAELNIKHARFLQQGYKEKFDALPKELQPFYRVYGSDRLPAVPPPLGDLNGQESEVDRLLNKYGGK